MILRRRLLFIVLLLVLCSLIFAVLTLRSVESFLVTPFCSGGAPPTGQATIITIPNGSSARQIAHLLQEQGIISSESHFMAAWRLRFADATMQAGEFDMTCPLAPLSVMQRLIRGKVLLHRLTIPEGLTAIEISGRITSAFAVDPAQLTALLTDTTLLTSRGITAAASLEGYLFPDTYYFDRHVSAEQIVTTMLDHFGKIWTDEMTEIAEQRGFSRHEIVTLASLIEKETALPEERELVAAVYVNRLKQGIRLQCDPTVIYGLPSFSGNLTKKDLDYDSPYNTYRYAGLPPGPICSPGKASLMAALHPADVPYLFFVARGDHSGRHVFSTTLADHNKAVYEEQILPNRRHRRSP